MAESFSITHMTKGRPPRLPFSRMKDSVLGKKYTLSLVFASDSVSKKLSATYRYKGERKRSNILSFPIAPNEGEIFINLKEAQKDAKVFGMSTRGFLSLLFIHGLLHLKGLPHGSTMMRKEANLLKRFRLYETSSYFTQHNGTTKH